MGIAVVAAVFGAAALVYSLSDAVPPLESLSVASGTLHTYEDVRSSSRFSSATPRFKLEGSGRLFQYVSKGGDLGLISNTLRDAKGKIVEVYFDEANPFNPLFEDVEIYTVYAVSIDGAVLRGYDEVTAAWESDSKFGVYMGAFFILAGLSFGIIGVRDKLRSD